MKIRYLLKAAKRGHSVFVALYQGQDVELLSTGHRCDNPVKDWNYTLREPKNHTSDLYRALEKMRTQLNDLLKLMEAHKEIITPFTLRQRFKGEKFEQKVVQHVVEKKEKKNLQLVTALCDKYIEEGLDNYRGNTPKGIKSSIKSFKTFIAYSKLKHLTRGDIDEDFITSYARYLTVKKGYADSSHGKLMKHLRWFLSYIKYEASSIKDIKVKRPKAAEGNKIVLTDDELTALENVDVTKSSEMQSAKDIFLIGCYTGLRISDLRRIRKVNINNGTINMTLEKTRIEVNIPIVAKNEKILKRYGYASPRITAQNANDAIKLVCKKAGINTPILFKSLHAGKLTETEFPKYEKITMHCAGKTFISMAENKYGLTVSEISAIVGKDPATIMKHYLKPNLAQAQRKMIEGDNRAAMKIA